MICNSCKREQHHDCIECPCQHRDPSTVTIIVTTPEPPTPSKDES